MHTPCHPHLLAVAPETTCIVVPAAITRGETCAGLPVEPDWLDRLLKMLDGPVLSA